MKARPLYSVVLLCAIMLGACGPSPEEIAAMTASAWTPTPKPTSTPLPTPTATPLPIDLIITVADEAGDPVSGARVIFPASGSSNRILTDEAGQVMWTNLPKPSGSLTIALEGYHTIENKVELEPGPNDVVFTLVRVPFGMIPSEACAPGETLLLARDFQDGSDKGWDAYPPGTPLKFVDDTVNPGDQILALDFGNVDGQFTLKTGPFDSNVVRRFWYRPGDHARFHIGWNTTDSIEASMSADGFSVEIWSAGASSPVHLGRGKPSMLQGTWHLMEISTIGDMVEFWVDGVLTISGQSPSVASGSDFYFGSAFLPPDSISYINNISICDLNGGSFTSIYPQE